MICIVTRLAFFGFYLCLEMKKEVVCDIFSSFLLNFLLKNFVVFRNLVFLQTK